MEELVYHHGRRTDIVRRFTGLALRLTRELYDETGVWWLEMTTRDRPILRKLAIEQQPRRPHRSIRRALRYIRPTSTDSLLDLGCGSGRLICFAAPFSFSRIIGVELNPGLAAIERMTAHCVVARSRFTQRSYAPMLPTSRSPTTFSGRSTRFAAKFTVPLSLTIPASMTL